MEDWLLLIGLLLPFASTALGFDCGGEDPWIEALLLFLSVVSLAGLTVTLEGPAAATLLLL